MSFSKSKIAIFLKLILIFLVLIQCKKNDEEMVLPNHPEFLFGTWKLEKTISNNGHVTQSNNEAYLKFRSNGQFERWNKYGYSTFGQFRFENHLAEDGNEYIKVDYFKKKLNKDVDVNLIDNYIVELSPNHLILQDICIYDPNIRYIIGPICLTSHFKKISNN